MLFKSTYIKTAIGFFKPLQKISNKFKQVKAIKPEVQIKNKQCDRKSEKIFSAIDEKIKTRAIGYPIDPKKIEEVLDKAEKNREFSVY